MSAGRRKQTKKPEYKQVKTGKQSSQPESALNNNLFNIEPGKITLLVILMLIVAGVVLAVHWPALSARALSFDDDQYLTHNQLVQHPGWFSTGQFLSEVLEPSTVSGYYQPLTMISLMLDYAMAGSVDNLTVFHRTSLVLHIANTILIIILLFLLFGEPWVAALIGLLFGIHPMTVETIPWVGERKTLLAAFFVLLSLISYLLYVCNVRISRKKFYWTSFVMYVLALMSKPTSTPLPLLLLLLDFWPIKRLNFPVTRQTWRLFLEKVPFFVIGIISAVITFISQKYTAGADVPGQQTLYQVPLVLCHNIIFYLAKMIWPVNLTSHYPLPEPLSMSNPVIMISVIGTSILLLILIISLRRTRALLTGWLFFFIAILPAMEIIGFSDVITSDKYAYLPAAGLLLTLAWLVSRFWNRARGSLKGKIVRNILIILMVFVLMLEFILTRIYLVSWRDSISLYTHMLSLAPKSPSLHYNLGLVLFEQGELDGAGFHFQEAARFYPEFTEAHYNLGIISFMRKDLNEAINWYQKAVLTNPDYAPAHFNLAYVLASQGKLAEAVACYQEAIRIDPNDVEAYGNIAKIMVQQNKLAEAISYFNQALQIQPNLGNIRFQLGKAFEKQGKYEEAIREYREILRIDPNDPDAQNALEVLSSKSGL